MTKCIVLGNDQQVNNPPKTNRIHKTVWWTY